MTKSQRDFLKELADLDEQNPDLDIRFCVGTEGLSDRYGSWMSHEIFKIEVRPWHETWDGDIVTDPGEITDLIGEEAFAQVKNVICVFTDPAIALNN